MRREKPVRYFGSTSDKAYEEQQSAASIVKELDVLLWSDQTNHTWEFYTEDDIKEIQKLCRDGRRHLKNIQEEVDTYKNNPLG